MARVGTAWYTRWRRYICAISLVAAVAGGAAAGVEARPYRPAALEASTASGWAAAPVSQITRLATTPEPAQQPLVVPQPRLRTPYGTPANTPAMGEAAQIVITEPAIQICDLLSDTVTRSVTVLDEAGEPVAGTYVMFTVQRSDIPEPQLVGDTTSVAGEARVTVWMPLGVSAASAPTYQIVATTATNAGPVQVSLEITNYTCQGLIAE